MASPYWVIVDGARGDRDWPAVSVVVDRPCRRDRPHGRRRRVYGTRRRQHRGIARRIESGGAGLGRILRRVVVISAAREQRRGESDGQERARHPSSPEEGSPGANRTFVASSRPRQWLSRGTPNVSATR